MRYTCSITIDLPREKVIELFDSTENLYKWQNGLKSVEHLEGVPGNSGAKSRLVYDMKGREVEMTEKIIHRDLPDELSAVYEAKNVWNSFVNIFVDTAPEVTEWKVESEFRCGGLMRLMTLVAPGVFKRQTLRDMNRFKSFAEGA
jgi:uncharacterized membrane protein